MPSALCKISHCWGSNTSKHRFPNPDKDLKMFNIWVQLCCNPRLKELTNRQIYERCRVCALHFLPGDFTQNNKLFRSAYPKINLPENVATYEESSSRLNNSMKEDVNRIPLLPNTEEQCFNVTSKQPLGENELIQYVVEVVVEPSDIKCEPEVLDCTIQCETQESTITNHLESSTASGYIGDDSFAGGEVMDMDCVLKCEAEEPKITFDLESNLADCDAGSNRLNNFMKEGLDAIPSLPNSPNTVEQSTGASGYAGDESVGGSELMDMDCVMKCEVEESKITIDLGSNLADCEVGKDRTVKLHKCMNCIKAITEKGDVEDSNCVRPVCRDCGNCFSTKASLNRHFRLQHLNIIHKCPHCEKICKNKESLKNHMAQMHIDDKPHKCTKCDKCFTQKKTLLYHLDSVHHDLRPHVCPDCGKCYVRKEQLSRHRCDKLFREESQLEQREDKRYTTIKPYKCNDCDKSYTLKESLKTHQMSEHLKIKHQCSDCDKSYARLAHLKEHRRSVHDNLKPYVCEDCNRGFTKKAYLVQHQYTAKQFNKCLS